MKMLRIQTEIKLYEAIEVLRRNKRKFLKMQKEIKL